MAKNNRGFSLVELIATIMIMGIVMVALAPQVVKWVQKSREGADAQKQGGLVSITQLVVAEYESSGVEIKNDSFVINSSGVVVVGGRTAEANTGMCQMFEEHLAGEYPKVLAEEGKVFQIRISEEGRKITVTTVDGNY